MAEAEETVANSVIEPARWGVGHVARLGRPQRRRIIGLTGCAGLLTLLFVQPLARTARSCAAERAAFLHPAGAGDRRLPAVYPAKDGRRLIAARLAERSGVGSRRRRRTRRRDRVRESLSVNDDLALMALAYVSFVAAGGFLFLGSKWMPAAAFPVAFLIFMVPLPDAAVNWLEIALGAGLGGRRGLVFQR